jgi:hypothetical protein
MKFNQWTLGLAAAGVVSLGTMALAEEAQNHIATALSSTTISGYVSTSAIWLIGDDDGAPRVPGRTFVGANKMDGFNLDHVGLNISSAMDESTWAAGYNVDLMLGTDANNYPVNSFGINNADFNITQAYVSLRAPVGNGIDFKVGAFDTIVGYEVSDYTANPNYTRSYGYFIEPFQHTGVLASYQVNDVLGISVGVANTYSTVAGQKAHMALNAIGNRYASESEKTYLAAITLTAPEDMGFIGGGELYMGIVDGIDTFANAAGTDKEDSTHYYVGAAIPTPVEGLAVGVAYDYNDGALGYAQALGAYASYQATEKLSLNGRVEWAKGGEGTWTTGLIGNEDEDQLLGITLSADYSLWDNVITRGEVRYDTDLSGDESFGSAADTEDYAVSLALNVIYKF